MVEQIKYLKQSQVVYNDGRLTEINEIQIVIDSADFVG